MVRDTPGQMVRSNNTPSHVVSSNSISSNMVKSDNTPIHMVSSSNFNSNNKSPSHMVRSIPSDQMVVRSNIPSHLMVRGNYIPSQHMLMMEKTGHSSQQHQTSALPRPSSSSFQAGRDTGGDKEVVVETSVSVSYTFKQGGGYNEEDISDTKHSGPPGHGLVCCTCMLNMPTLQVGECGCLACKLCLVKMIQPGYCEHCQITVKYKGLEKIINFPDKGQLGKLFMTREEMENMSTKEFFNRVLKEEIEFKIVSRIFDKQEAAFVRRNNMHLEEVEIINAEKEELKRKIAEKSKSIAELEKLMKAWQQQM